MTPVASKLERLGMRHEFVSGQLTAWDISTMQKTVASSHVAVVRVKYVFEIEQKYYS